MKTKKENWKVGEYFPFVQKKGEQEASGVKLMNGEVFWTIKTSKDTYLDTLRQEDAVIISLLLDIQKRLKRK